MVDLREWHVERVDVVAPSDRRPGLPVPPAEQRGETGVWPACPDCRERTLAERGEQDLGLALVGHGQHTFDEGRPSLAGRHPILSR